MITITHHHVHHYYAPCGLSDEQYKSIFSLLNKISMNVEEAVAKVNAQAAQLTKIGTEVTAVKDALAAAIEAGNTVPQALADAINAVGVEIQTVDDLNADAPQA